MHTLPEIEAARQAPNPDLRAITAAIRELGERMRALRLGASIALQHPYDDLRPALQSYVLGHARLLGTSTAGALQQLIEDGDPWLPELALRAWGLAL